MLDNMKAAKVKLDSDPSSMGDVSQKAGINTDQPTVMRGKKQHMCDLCGRCFSNQSNMRRHRRIHTSLRAHTCDVCSSSFRQKSQLDRHHLVHTGERPHQCPHCKKGLRDSTELKAHLRVHTGERPYSCPICKKGFSRIFYMKIHIKKHSNNKPRTPIKSRRLTVTTNENKEVVEEYQCSYCSGWFLSKEELEDHCAAHVKLGFAGQKLYECVECKKRFNNSYNLRKHAIIHTGLRPFTCNLCNQSFRQASTLQRHRLVHTGERPFKCCICLKDFRDSSGLQKHQRLHKDSNPYQCQVGEKSFEHLHSAQLHQEQDAKDGLGLDERPLPPPSCSVTMSNEEGDVEELQSEVLKVRSKDTPREADKGGQILKCSLCPRTFTRISTLHGHYLMHTGYRPFSCHTCSKTFQHKSSLYRHRQVQHREWRDESSACHKAFHASTDLLHKEAHRKGKLFSCNKCEKTYTQVHYLESHQKSHEQETDIPTDADKGNSIEVVLV